MKWFVVGFLVLSVLHIHFRGKVRLPFGRHAGAPVAAIFGELFR